MKKDFAYCLTCERSIPKPIKKPMESRYKSLWFLIIISTIGIGLIPLLLYLSFKKKKYCPHCEGLLKIGKVIKNQDLDIGL
ncbi:MAG: hypothetical protein GF383_09340 [Candidatus Lokiarchaeota archaeon]|nr:hypothetical protein [Candidatus Lokiarchaeota archaeon]MBD3340717.1 hypothetical protein [Candidatus Lokiarchaeota archaeon]